MVVKIVKTQSKINQFSAIYLLQFAKFACSLVGTIILARLIMPNEFGIFAIAHAYIAVSYTFRDGGLSNIILQEKKLSNDHFALIFFASISFGIILSMIYIMALKHLIMNLYDSKKIASTLHIIAFGFLAYGCYTPMMSHMRRNLKFVEVEFIATLAQYLSLGLAITLAFMDKGVYALAYQLLFIDIFSLLGCLFLFPLKNYVFKIDRDSFSIFKNAFNSFQAVFVSAGSNYLDRFLLSFFESNLTMGFYSKSKQVLMIPQRLLIKPMRGVLIPYLSQSQNDVIRIEIFSLYQLAVLVGPSGMLVICSFFPHEVVSVLLGPNWHAATDIFRIIAFILAVELIVLTTEPYLISIGNYRYLARWSYTNAILSILSISIGSLWGIWGILYASFITVLIKVVISAGIINSVMGNFKRVFHSKLLSLIMIFFLLCGYAFIIKKIALYYFNSAIWYLFPSTIIIYSLLALTIWFSPYLAIISKYYRSITNKKGPLS